ncbi:MAG: cation:proton antiporter subunit C [Elainellaceae cyanobacterium]
MSEACIFATVLCGFFGIIFKQNLLMKILSMDVMSTGVVALYIWVAARSGRFTPIASSPATASSAINSAEAIAYADPVPQAVILTAIVIGLSIQALMLVGVMKLARDNPTLDISEIEKSHRP